MSANYDAVLWLPGGKPSPLLLGFWRARDPDQPLQASVPLLEADLTANLSFQRAWRAAFPSRGPLPTEPVATRNGRGTVEFWKAFD